MLGYCVTDLTKVNFTLESNYWYIKKNKRFSHDSYKLKGVRYLVVYLSHGGYANRDAENSKHHLAYDRNS